MSDMLPCYSRMTKTLAKFNRKLQTCWDVNNWARTYPRTHARTDTHTETEYVDTSGYFCVKFDVRMALPRGDSTDHTPEQGSCSDSSLVYLISRKVLEVPTTSYYPGPAPSVGTSWHTTKVLRCNISRFVVWITSTRSLQIKLAVLHFLFFC
jgi:hypothetical protein